MDPQVPPDAPGGSADPSDAVRVAPSGRPATEPAGTRRQVALQWGISGLLAPPLAVLPHELGHHLVHLELGLPDAALHYSSASWTGSGVFWDAIRQGNHAAAAAIAPVSGVATSYAMGLAATYLVVLACCWLCTKWRPHPLLVAVGYLSNLRIVGPGSVVVLQMLGFGVRSTCDECQLSVLTGVPLGILVLLGLVSLVGAGIWLTRYFPRANRRIAAASLVLGLAIGMAVYRLFLGPLLLP